MRRVAWLWLVAALASPAIAGRPVFQELALEELTASAKLIALARWEEAPTPPQDGCVRFAPRVRLVKLLKAPVATPGARAVAAGDTLEVLLNATGLRDCQYRKDHGRSGVSFSAVRVDSALKGATFGKGDEFLVFLSGEGPPWSLTVDGAMLSHEQVKQVSALLAKPQGAGASSPFNGPPMASAPAVAPGPAVAPAPTAAPRGARYPVSASWPVTTVAQFCLKQLPKSTVTGGERCIGGVVPLERSYGDYTLQPCESPTSAAAVKWRALYCAVEPAP